LAHSVFHRLDPAYKNLVLSLVMRWRGKGGEEKNLQKRRIVLSSLTFLHANQLINADCTKKGKGGGKEGGGEPSPGQFAFLLKLRLGR